MRRCPSQEICRGYRRKSPSEGEQNLRSFLEAFYERFNRKEFVHPDPLEFLYHYPDVGDREVVGIVASSLAYGRVAQILKSTKRVLDIMGPRPVEFLMETSREDLSGLLGGFVHRFTKGKDLAELLLGLRAMLEKWGSLENAITFFAHPRDGTIHPALCGFLKELDFLSRGAASRILASPWLGSSCKRLYLFLRWMVREDEVDPGGWRGISPSKLIVPLDVHMHRVGMMLGFTERKQADILTAMEITEGFARICPEDPVKYDFVLTRPGIWRKGEGFWEERRRDGIWRLQHLDRG